MKKKYLNVSILLLFFSFASLAQESRDSSFSSLKQEEALNIYPNPATSDKIYLTSKNNLLKEIEIFDVLGKRIQQISITTKELNISSLSPGVYIVKIKEGDLRATRKLIIK